MIFTRIDFAPNFREMCYDLGDPFLPVVGEDILDAMRVHLPASTDGSYGRPPGYARSRLRQLEHARDRGGPPYIHVGTDATTPDGVSYPSILEHGSPPHVIEAHGNYSLRRGNQYFGRVVHHPGIKPIPWARRSAQSINGRRYYLR